MTDASAPASDRLKSSPRYLAALIIDPDRAYLEELARHPDFNEGAFKLYPNMRQAQLKLQSRESRFSAIFVSASATNPGAIPLLRTIRAHHPVTPTYLTYDRMPPLTNREAWRVGLRATLAKPLDFPAIRRLASPWVGKLPQVTAAGGSILALDSATAAQAVLGATESGKSPQDSDFISVPVEDFFSGRPSIFDVFIRIKAGHYIRVLNAKDTIDPQRLLRFRQGGVRELHLAKQSVERCLSYCDLLSRNLMANTDISTEMKLLSIASEGAELARTLEERAAEDSFAPNALDLDHAVTIIQHVEQLLRNLGKNRAELIAAFLANAAAMEHAVAVTIGTALLAGPLGIESTPARHQLGLASLFHDLGLAELPAELRSEDARVHPIRGAEILATTGYLDTAALQAVAQHHERRDNTGFPKKKAAGQISVQAELIGIADEFVRLLSQGKAPEALAQMHERVFKGFSFPVVEAFRAIFG